MAPPIDPEHVASIMLSWHSLELISCKKLQTLWAGYGFICGVTAEARTDAAAASTREICDIQQPGPPKEGESFDLILKLICPPQNGSGLGTKDEGHLRKMLSYEVEQYFYSVIAPQLSDEATVARCLCTTRELTDKPGGEKLQGLTATIMTDLRPKFPVAGQKREVLNETQVLAALKWLGRFHGESRAWSPTSLSDSTLPPYVLPPLEEAKLRATRETRRDESRVWLNGGYTYLATRRTEFAGLLQDSDSEWARALCREDVIITAPNGSDKPTCIAELVANRLAPRGRNYESYIHGDVKSENLFTTSSGEKVAFFDFQYVGLGLGVCDLAKLFTCSVPLHLLTTATADYDDHDSGMLEMDKGERKLLEIYRQELFTAALSSKGEEGLLPELRYDWATFKRHWETALVDWHRFQVSWGQWGNSDWLEARVRSILKDEGWREWLLNSED